MKEKIKIFLDTDLVEKYLLGNTTQEESLQVERYIAMYPEVQKTYDELQENLETFAKMHAVKTPEGLKERIITRIRTERVERKKFFQYGIAASVTAVLFAIASVFFYQQNKDLQEENVAVSNKIETLEQKG